MSGLNPELRERFLREARVGVGLEHPAVLPVFETGEGDGSLWLAMPFVKGQTLDAVELDAAGAARCVAAAARGVQAAHDAGVIHRDIKPRNIMLSGSGAIVVMDFGLALTRDESTRISVTGQVLGTPQYMAPEQAAGRTADARTDVYGLGATLYRLLAGRAPYECGTVQEFLATIAFRDPDPPSKHAPVPHDLGTIVLKAMDRNPVRRYPSAAAFTDDPERFVAGESVCGRRLPIPVRVGRVLRRHPRILVALLAPLVALGLWSLGRSSGRTDARPVMHPVIARGLALHQSGNPRGALAEFATIPADDSPFADALRYSADAHIMLRQYREAAAELARYLDLRPGEAVRWRERAKCLQLSGDLDGALADINRGIAITPRSADLLLTRARIHIDRNEMDLALADHDSAIGLEPSNAWVRHSRELLLVEQHRFVDAIRDFDVAIEEGGRQPEWIKERGRAKLRIEDFAGAARDLNEAVSLDPRLAPQCAEDTMKALEAARARGH